jgi:hypothetical protein
MWETIRLVVGILVLRLVRSRFLIHAAVTLFILWAGVMMSGGYFDSICVEGRLSAEQAEVLNQMDWEKCPSYRQGSGCLAEAGDRVIIRECSELSRKFFLQSFRRLWWP